MTLKVSRIQKVEKVVSIRETYCPDCGNALYWVGTKAQSDEPDEMDSGNYWLKDKGRVSL